MLDGKKVQKAFHVTTLYLGRDACKDPVLLQQLVGLLGESIELTPTSVVSDPKGTAIAVRNEGEFPCENAHPHITIANAPGVPPVYSNELLDDSHADDPCRTVVSLPTGTRVPGHLSSGSREGHCGARRWLQWHPLPPHAGLVGRWWPWWCKHLLCDCIAECSAWRSHTPVATPLPTFSIALVLWTSAVVF
ncbi:hypothetical protein C4B63_247g13 [Trypanosoma cruzi]|uniref:tRNA ligase phosphodiesterase domain-containing protein n=1 Tax=Trypanosoma cruzi TaxID=5693 RepID=A0A2V2UJ03_TRYCR|nr:hypothetical protein C4B63_247g13 [Trypanosoma cruzi]